MSTVAVARSSRPTAADHRALMSSFPTGVTVVTTVDLAGRPHGMTCTSLTSVSVEPPTVLICLSLTSRTYLAVRESRVFALNLLHPSGRRAAEVFSTPAADRFTTVAWVESPAGLPWLSSDAFAMTECSVTAVHLAADHAIVVGTVNLLTQQNDDVLMYGMRRFSRWSVSESEAPP